MSKKQKNKILMCMIGLEILFSIQKYSFQWQKYVKHFVDFLEYLKTRKKILLLTFKASKMITTHSTQKIVFPNVLYVNTTFFFVE